MRLGQQGAHDLHALAFAHGQRMHVALRFQVQAVLARCVFDALRQLRHVGACGQTEGDVFRDRQSVEQGKVLEHHGDAERARSRRVGDLDLAAIPHDAAAVGLHGAIDDFHQGRFAGAVFAEHGVDLPRLDGEADAVIGYHGRIAFADVV